jgi:hypothetical protein
VIRASRVVRIRGMGAGLTLNLAPQSTSCPPGYHWEAPGPIMGLQRGTRRLGAMAACVKDPTAAPAPARKVIALHLGPAPAPAPAPAPKKNLPFTLGPAPTPATYYPTTTPDVVPTSDTVEAPAEEPVTVECPPCWPWWWLLVAGGAGAAVVAVARSSKGKKKDGRKLNPIVARMVNAGTHHVIRAVMR